MRIIGGAFRGRRLASVGKGDEVARLRPTSDRVRESLFNVLMSRFGDRVAGARVLDLFAGTGALGLEALSRGAETAVFVENGRTALRILHENIQLCGVSDATRILSQDARKLGNCTEAGFDLVFLDPPYNRDLGEIALTRALSKGWLSDTAFVIWEEGGAVALPEDLEFVDARGYGDTVITLATRA